MHAHLASIDNGIARRGLVSLQKWNHRIDGRSLAPPASLWGVLTGWHVFFHRFTVLWYALPHEIATHQDFYWHAYYYVLIYTRAGEVAILLCYRFSSACWQSNRQQAEYIIYFFRNRLKKDIVYLSSFPRRYVQYISPTAADRSESILKVIFNLLE